MDSIQIAQRHGGPVDSLDRSLWDLFVATATAHPGHDAVVSLWQTDSKDDQQPGDYIHTKGNPTVIRWTYSELLRRAEALAAGLQAKGCASGVPLVAFLGNSAEWALLFWAAARLQLPFVPLDPRGLENPGEVAKILDLVKPGAVVVSDAIAARVLVQTTSAWTACVRTQIITQVFSSEPMEDGWESLSSVVLAHTTEPKEVVSGISSAELDDVALVVFTSGTTATPKGCLHTAANLLSQINDFDPQGAVVDRWLVHTPVSHVFAINNALRAWSRGDTVVFPSEYFDVQATMRALIYEKCTFMSAVPTMVKALLAQPSFPGKDAIHLTYMTLGGTTISAADIKLCQDQFGAKTAIQSFGMSEGVPVTSWNRQDPLLKDGYHAGVGKVLPGASIRVCAPDSKTPLAVNEVGELHIGGTSVIRGYLGGTAFESFYTDDAGHWLITGDQAVIDGNGVLHILGRYKDLIIRAGENIAPLKIEGALANIEGVTAQVVGIPDAVAGELPVAIVRMPTKTQILEAASSLGAKYSLSGVYTFEDLGLDHFPITRTGKIRKEALRAAVLRQKHMSADPYVSTEDTAPSAVSNTNVAPPRSPPQSLSQVPSESFDKDITGVISNGAHPPQSPSKSSLEAKVPIETSYLVTELSSIVSDILGSLPSPGADLRGFMDSVSMLRYTDRVLRRLGQKLYLQDILEHPTLADQAALLESRGNHQATPLADTTSRQRSVQENQGLLVSKATSTVSNDGFGPAELITPLASTSPELQKAALSVLKQIHLSPLDVEAMYPIRANYHRFISKQRPQTYRHRMCFNIRGATLPRIRQALEAALAPRALLRAILVRVPMEHTSYHLAVRAHAIVPHMITAVQVPDAAGLEALYQDDAAKAFHPYLAVQAQLVTVQGTGEIHLLLTYSHAVFDLLSIEPFHRDLDVLLSAPDLGTVALPPRTPFRLFSDLYHNNDYGTLAKASVQATAHRLRGISKIPAALWPQQRAPGWMIGNDADADEAPRRALLRERLWTTTTTSQAAAAAAAAAATTTTTTTMRHELRFPRVSRVVHLPGIQELQTQHDLQPQTVAMAALAVLNVLQTGQGYAIFNTIDAGRTWPFVPASLEALLPSAMGVDGPTVEWLLHMLRVDLHGKTSFESVGQFLGRVQREQDEAAKHAHAPWDQVLEALGPEEGRVAADAVSRQTFVWDVSLTMARGRTDYTSLTFEARYDWADCGFYWNCCMIDRESLMFLASWDTAQMTDREVHKRCDEFADVLRRITDVENWDAGLAKIML